MSERASLVAICTQLSLPTVGSLPALRKRAADALLAKALVALETSTEPTPKKRRANPFHEFVKEQKPHLLEAGWKKGTLMAELRRMWHEKKDKPSDDTPLMLTYVSDSDTEDISTDKLVEALYSWPMTSLIAELSLHGHPTNGSKPELVQRLATAMLAA